MPDCRTGTYHLPYLLERKLKCDGVKPACYQCQTRSKPCVYDALPRRRGPGRKNKGGERAQRRQRGRVQRSEASTSMSTLAYPSSSAFPDLPSPSYQTPTPLPGPPIPQYNYYVGIPPTPPRLVTGPLSSSDDSIRTHGQHRFHSYSEPSYTRSSQHRDHAQQDRPEQYHLPLTTPQPALQHTDPEQGHMYREEPSQASTSDYSAQIGDVVYHGEQSSQSRNLGYPAEGRDIEGPSHPGLKRRRASSTPENNVP